MAAGEATAVIGKSVQIRGEVKGNEDLVVEGVVEGTITLSGNRLTVGQHARVKANVVGRDVIVLGVLEGDVQATGTRGAAGRKPCEREYSRGAAVVESNAIYSGKVELDGTGAGSEGAKAAGQRGESGRQGGSEFAGSGSA